MEDLIGFLFEILGEFILELLVSFFSRAMGVLLDTEEPAGPSLLAIGLGFFGVIAGALSFVVFPHPIIAPSKLHGISLILSPTVTGTLMALIGFVLRRHGKQPTQIETFIGGFSFAFGLSLTRFLSSTNAVRFNR